MRKRAKRWTPLRTAAGAPPGADKHAGVEIRARSPVRRSSRHGRNVGSLKSIRRVLAHSEGVAHDLVPVPFSHLSPAPGSPNSSNEAIGMGAGA
jgi:hypothetical protein